MSERLAQTAATPVLILAHDGVAAADLVALEAAAPNLRLAVGYDDALCALAQGWAALSSFGPLKGHRQKGEELLPGAPWFGAERTDPDLFLRRMGPAIMPGIVQVPDGASGVGIVTRHLFWTWDEAEILCSFFLGALPGSLLILPVGPAEELEAELKRKSGWRDEAVERAVAAMAGHARQAAAAFPGRAVTWSLEEPGKAPAQLLAALNGAGS